MTRDRSRPPRDPRQRCDALDAHGRDGDRDRNARRASGSPIGVFGLAYLVVIGRPRHVRPCTPATAARRRDPQRRVATGRPDLVDRNGEILATDIKMASLYAEPRNILDPDEATELITSVLPDLDAGDRPQEALRRRSGFVWLKREITPEQQAQIHALGIPGIGFLRENKRFYPGGPTAAHIVGLVNIDNQGIAGIEKYVDDHGLSDLHTAGLRRQGEDLEPVKLSIDLRVQHILRDELVQRDGALQGDCRDRRLLNVHTGEVLAMASLPDYDPNNPVDALKPDRLNRMSAGVYELGSVFKSFTFAMALDSGKVTHERQHRRVSALHCRPLHHPRLPRQASRADACRRSSPIRPTSARRGWRSGSVPEGQHAYLERFGLLDKVKTELPEAPSRSCRSAGRSSPP